MECSSIGTECIPGSIGADNTDPMQVRLSLGL